MTEPPSFKTHHWDGVRLYVIDRRVLGIPGERGVAEAGFTRSTMGALRGERVTLGLGTLGDPDVLTCMARVAPVCFKTLRLVCRDIQAAANAPALGILAEARATFNRLMAEVHPIDVATLSKLKYEYADCGSDSGSDSDGDSDGDSVRHSYATASSELIEHQDSVWRARELLLDVQVRVGFLTSVRSILHAGALVILHVAWSAQDLDEQLCIAYPPRDLLFVDRWEEGGFLENTSRLIDEGQRKADLQAMYGDISLDHSRRDKAAILTACKRAGVTAPLDCGCWDDLQRDAPRVIEEARRSREEFHQQAQRRARAQREEIARARRTARRTACLHHAIRQMGLEPRSDSALQRSCVASAHTMHQMLGETLRCAVWMHWLHTHTHGKYKRTVEYEKDDYRESYCDGTSYRVYPSYREAVDRVQALPCFQMPVAIPWLTPPHNRLDEVTESAARAVRARMVWRRAFQRIKCLLVFAPVSEGSRRAPIR